MGKFKLAQYYWAEQFQNVWALALFFQCSFTDCSSFLILLTKFSGGGFSRKKFDQNRQAPSSIIGKAIFLADGHISRDYAMQRLRQAGAPLGSTPYGFLDE
ncbi:hypothetical protein [Telmatospirillum sp.]|uniref:hypothetical protein n=1 Tax=Telmatospirillum sp. TaxID=2079197 RepID=UPI002846C37B|nr:hypothetical protein [Telmatospirillum sp.]MDR3438873.1 hypothetical protein [Telmatospirillum sp.]